MTSQNETTPDLDRGTKGAVKRPRLSRKAQALLFTPIAITTGLGLGAITSDWATDDTYDDRINACVAALESGEAGPRAACESLNSTEEKQEAAYRWAVQQGAMK